MNDLLLILRTRPDQKVQPNTTINIQLFLTFYKVKLK